MAWDPRAFALPTVLQREPHLSPLYYARDHREKPTFSLIFPDLLPICLTFLGDFNLQKLPLGRLQTPWEWKNRVLLEEYYIFDVVIPLEVE